VQRHPGRDLDQRFLEPLEHDASGAGDVRC
jgi:hypothetical protein